MSSYSGIIAITIWREKGGEIYLKRNHSERKITQKIILRESSRTKAND